MIEIRELKETDSEACIQLKLNRQKSDLVKVLETRKNSFFDIYKIYSNEYVSLGAFKGNLLIGMCSFIKLNSTSIKYFVTDLVVLKEFNGSYIGPRLLDAFWNKKLSMLPSFELYAVEEILNSLETFKNYLKKYEIDTLEDRYVYTHLKKTIKDEIILNGFNPAKDSIIQLDKEAVQLSIAGESYILFSDDIFRRYTSEGQDVTRLYVKGSVEKNIDDIIPFMCQRANKRNIDYILILSEKKIVGPFDYIYMNRVLSFSKNSSITSTLDFENGILI